ncbi:hypothetical protein EON67_07525 [archaeon]|nr:MAG: hypothetical protein EON67_07525 [archaeon]
MLHTIAALPFLVCGSVHTLLPAGTMQRSCHHYPRSTHSIGGCLREQPTSLAFFLFQRHASSSCSSRIT